MQITQFAHKVTARVARAATLRAPHQPAADSVSVGHPGNSQQDWLKLNRHRLSTAPAAEKSSEKTKLDEDLRKSLRHYLENPVQFAAGREGQPESLGFQAFLDDSDRSLQCRAKRQLPPGVVTMLMHGRTPGSADDPKRLNDVAARPFVGPQTNWSGQELAANIVGPEGAPVMLLCCNAGTKRFYTDPFGKVQSSSGAAEAARESGRIIIAPVNGRYNCTASGGRLEKNANSSQEPYWGVFYPGGNTERL